jgi:hypothetical protein
VSSIWSTERAMATQERRLVTVGRAAAIARRGVVAGSGCEPLTQLARHGRTAGRAPYLLEQVIRLIIANHFGPGSRSSPGDSRRSSR